MTTVSYPPNERPPLVTAIAVMTLFNGIINIFWGLAAALTVMATIVGILCVPFAILPTVLGIFEIIFAAKLLGNPAQPVRPSQAIAVLEIVCILAGNVLSMIVGILCLVFYNDASVKEYFARLNGTLPSAPTDSGPAPVEPPAPQPDQAPRKIAENQD